MEALDSQEDCKHSNKNKQMSIGRKKFNMDPKKGESSNIYIFLYDYTRQYITTYYITYLLSLNMFILFQKQYIIGGFPVELTKKQFPHMVKVKYLNKMLRYFLLYECWLILQIMLHKTMR